MDDLLNLVIVGVMFFTSYFISKRLVKLNYFNFLFIRKGRYGGIDGLRGYLAISVFIHHFIITWYWHNTGVWTRPPEDYFQNFGKIGVMIFFMITGFLFISKMISDNGKTNWFKLYKSRIFRIYPLYLFILLVISIIVFYQTNFHINVNFFVLIKDYIKWFIYYGGNINDYSHTKIIIAGVDWTLKYEWLFYLSLPLIAWIISKNKIIIFLSLLIILIISYLRLNYFEINTMHFFFFIVGGLVAYLNSLKLNITGFIQSSFSTIFILILLLISLFYHHTYGLLQVICVSIFFTFIALGNTIFGFLNKKVSIFLGEISYSIYLIHGLVLYTLFSVLNIVNIKGLSLLQYEYAMPVIIIFVIFISTITHILVELPGIRYGKK